LDEQILSETGNELLLLPPISRLGLMRVQPNSTEYVSARYLYNDAEPYIHAPVVQWTWISAIKNYLRINDVPATGIVVGFVPDEDFEVHLAGDDSFAKENIVY